jgi:hypothetical protein
MSTNWEIILDHQEQRRKVSTIDGRARAAGTDAAAEEVEFSLTLFADQVSLNVPASTLGREFIADLTAILGPPKLEPTVKCSCSWGQGIMGAMLIVLWDLAAPTAFQQLQELRTFLGSTPAGAQ